MTGWLCLSQVARDIIMDPCIGPLAMTPNKYWLLRISCTVVLDMKGGL